MQKKWHGDSWSCSHYTTIDLEYNSQFKTTCLLCSPVHSHAHKKCAFGKKTLTMILHVVKITTTKITSKQGMYVCMSPDTTCTMAKSKTICPILGTVQSYPCLQANVPTAHQVFSFRSPQISDTNTHTHTQRYTHTHTYIHTYIHPHAYIHTYIQN